MLSIFRFRKSSTRRRTLGSKSAPKTPLMQRGVIKAVKNGFRAGLQQASKTGQPVRRANTAVGNAVSTAIRTVMSPLESLVTVTIEDTTIRVVISRGYKVSSWHEAELPEGVVTGGQIQNPEKFEEILFEALEAPDSKFRFGDRRVAVAISGRNHVHRRFSLFVPKKVRLEKAVLETLRSDLHVIGDEMLLDWEAEGSRPINAEEKTVISQQMSTDESSVPDGSIYTVYSAGLRRQVVENNLETLSLVSKRMAGVQPKTLALGAAVNELYAIIVDIEVHSFSVIVLKNGLPEVVRESSFIVSEDKDVLSVAIKGHIGRAVAFINSQDPEDQLEDDIPLFLTGAGAADPELVAILERELPFQFKQLPKTLRAPEQFPFNRFASNVGLALVAGKRFWQLTRIPIVNDSKFDLRPAQYKPKPVPIKALAKTAAAAALVLGLLSATVYTNDRRQEIKDTEAVIESLERLDASLTVRNRQLTSIERETEQVEAATDEYRSVTESLSAIDRGHSDLVEMIFLQAPDGISVTRYDDTGSVLSFVVSGVDHEETLLFVESLSESPLFRSVQIDRVSLPAPDGDNDGLVDVVVLAQRSI